jgi:hypothetical protein
VVPSASGAASSADLSPGLAQVISAWDQLPEAFKTAILALVEAARQGN